MKDWNDLTEDVAAAADFLFTSSKIGIFRVGYAPPVSNVDDG